MTLCQGQPGAPQVSVQAGMSLSPHHWCHHEETLSTSHFSPLGCCTAPQDPKPRQDPEPRAAPPLRARAAAGWTFIIYYFIIIPIIANIQFIIPNIQLLQIFQIIRESSRRDFRAQRGHCQPCSRTQLMPTCSSSSKPFWASSLK